MKIVIIGGTGLIGSKLVSKLRQRGHDAVPASLDTGVNTISGEGLGDALAGADVVIDVSNSPSLEESAALKFFETSTRNLLAAEAAAGVGHHVALSVVGNERMPDSGYQRAKGAQEKLIRESAIPYSIVHATQFFEFLKSITDAATTNNAVRLPPVLFQPMAADDVAETVARVSVGQPVNGVFEVGGPLTSDLVRRPLPNAPASALMRSVGSLSIGPLGANAALASDGCLRQFITISDLSSNPHPPAGLNLRWVARADDFAARSLKGN